MLWTCGLVVFVGKGVRISGEVGGGVCVEIVGIVLELRRPMFLLVLRFVQGDVGDVRDIQRYWGCLLVVGSLPDAKSSKGREAALNSENIRAIFRRVENVGVEYIRPCQKSR